MEKETNGVKAIKRHIKITFTEPVFAAYPIEDGSVTVNKNVDASRGISFPRVDSKPVFYDHQIKDYFKNTCDVLARTKATRSSKLKSYKKTIDESFSVYPSFIPIDVNGEMSKSVQIFRPQNMRRRKPKLTVFEEVPVGSTINFDVTLLNPSHEKLLEEWLERGLYRGLGQWNVGRFTYTMSDEAGTQLGGTAEHYEEWLHKQNFFPKELE